MEYHTQKISWWRKLFKSSKNVINSNIDVMLDSTTHTVGTNSDYKTFKFEDLKSAMFQWYAKSLFKWPLEDLSVNERSLLHKCSKVITYMKLFIPSDCELFSNPVNSGSDTNGYNVVISFVIV